MLTQFVTITVNYTGSIAPLQAAIARELQAIGEPLRWAITHIDRDRQTVQVEAVVTLHTLSV